MTYLFIYAGEGSGQDVDEAGLATGGGLLRPSQRPVSSLFHISVPFGLRFTLSTVRRAFAKL